MNNTNTKEDIKRSNINSSSIIDLTSLDNVNLKIGQRPVKFYKLIHCDKSKIHDYHYLLEKIKSNANSSGSSSFNNLYSLTIYLKCNSREEIKISNEEDWRNFFEESSKTILELLDSKNTLKIEYTIAKINSNSSITNSQINTNSNSVNEEQEEKLKKIFIERDRIGMDILKSVFTQTLRNESIKNKIKEELLSNSLKNENLESVVNSRSFDYILKRFFDKTLDKIQNINLLQNSIQNEAGNESEILFDDDEEEESVFTVPPFSEFYKNEQIDNFRSKILSDTFAEYNKEI